MLSNYPPGVSGNEPHLTGEWPCLECHGAGSEVDSDGEHLYVNACPRCGGSGIEPEEFDFDYVVTLADEGGSLVLMKETLEMVEDYDDHGNEKWGSVRDELRKRIREREGSR